MEGKRIRVLLIEDNPGDTRLIRELLIEEGSNSFTFECADSALAGIHMLERREIDVILLDLGLPDSQGLDTLHRVHSKAKTIPIIVFTVISDETIGIKAIQEGAQDYLVKGRMDGNLLARTIRYAIERKRTLEALRENKEKYKRLSQEFHALLDIIPDNLTLQSTDFKVLWANKGAADGLGKETSDLVGQYCYKLWYNRSTPCESCSVQRSFLTGEVSSDEVTAPDGGIWELRSVPIFDDRGNVVNVVKVGRNITERKKAEEVRLENMRLTLATKAKSEFLANMSHELRTPLNSVIGFSELLHRAGELNEKQEHYVDNILTSGKHLLGLISDILDLSKIEAGKIELEIENISVPGIIDESLILVKEISSKHNIILKKELDPEVDFIQADKLRLKQILFNLISNSVKFSKPEGGKIIIKVKKDADMVKFQVSDTGIGIKEKDMGRLFKEFEQLDAGVTRKYGGTGLGLAISKKLVELHGGKIWAESTYGEGSTFTFLLPVVCDFKESVRTSLENNFYDAP